MVRYKLVWTRLAQLHLKALYNYIAKDSPKNALQVVQDIIRTTEKAIINPECYPPDKFKINNDGSYRAFEKHHYRIVYRYDKKVIRVLRVRHTKMEPLAY